MHFKQKYTFEKNLPCLIVQHCNMMAMCDGDGIRVYMADNVGIGTTAKYAHMWATPWCE
jgi:hypothetical protein